MFKNNKYFLTQNLAVIRRVKLNVIYFENELGRKKDFYYISKVNRYS